MRDRDGARPDDLLRGQLRRLAEDVEPRPDALPTLLASVRRRRSPRRSLIATASTAVAATALFLVALLAFPVGEPHGAQPVNVGPQSYAAQPQPGLIATFDVVSGRQLEILARVPDATASPLAADGNRVYVVVPGQTANKVIEIGRGGSQRAVQTISAGQDGTPLAASSGRVAYLDGATLVVSSGDDQRRVPVPSGIRVFDLALDPAGRLAVLSAPDTSGPAGIQVLEPDAVSWEMARSISSVRKCGPVAITWSGADLAALQPVVCGSGQMRVTTLDPNGDRQIGGGAPFDAGPRPLDVGTQLTTDALGRFLVSAPDARQWLVDGAEVRPLAPACASGARCVPGTFWG